MCSYQIPGAWDFVKRPQLVEETTYGVTPTSSPTFTSLGVNAEINDSTETSLIRYRQLGSRNVYDFLKTGELYSFETVYSPISSTIMRYGTENPNGTGTIEKSLSVLSSQNLDQSGTFTEMYTFREGAKTDRIRIEITPDSFTVRQNWICQNITTPASAHGLTTPTFASADTAAPWVGPSGGTNPFTHNSITYDVDRFVFDVSWSLDAIKPNGATQIQFLFPTNKTVTGEFDVLPKSTVLKADMKTLTKRAATYTLNSTGPKTATFTNMVLLSMAEGHKATQNSVRRDSFRFEATDVSITA